MTSIKRLACLLCVGLVGCGGSGGGDDDVTVVDNVHVLDNDNRVTDVAVAPDSLVVSVLEPTDLDLSVGDYVVGTAGPGYLRKITGISTAPDRVELTTGYASLAEVIEHGSSHQTFDFSTARMGTARAKVPLVDLSGKVLFDDSVGGVPLTVTITNGTVDLNYDYDFDIDIGFFRINKFEATATGSIDGVLDVSLYAGGPIDFSKEIDLNGSDPFFEQDINFNIGPIPVKGSISVDLKAGFAVVGDAEGTLTTGAEAHASLEVGAKYVHGDGWSLIWDPGLTYSKHPLNWTADATIDLTAWVRPTIKTTLYGNPGPGLDLKKVFRTRIEKHLSGLRSAEPTDYLQTVCLTGDLDYEVRILGFDLANYSAHLPCDPEVIDEAGTVSDDPAPEGEDDLSDADQACEDAFGTGWQACADDGRCIYESWYCDVIPDCTDGSDEVDCTDNPDDPKPTCEEQFGDGWTSCPSNGQCVHSSWFCDLIPDCPDGEDEVNDADGNPC